MVNGLNGVDGRNAAPTVDVVISPGSEPVTTQAHNMVAQTVAQILVAQWNLDPVIERDAMILILGTNTRVCTITS